MAKNPTEKEAPTGGETSNQDAVSLRRRVVLDGNGEDDTSHLSDVRHRRHSPFCNDD